ncbi:MAG TPA: hypothetical protein VJM47_11320 [Nitrosospira sp.]|nr:hypothetical protein [Nitrosospira sp.]
MCVLQVCDVELQPGEQANFLHLGDTRLNSEPAVTGSAKNVPNRLLLSQLEKAFKKSELREW